MTIRYAEVLRKSSAPLRSPWWERRRNKSLSLLVLGHWTRLVVSLHRTEFLNCFASIVCPACSSCNWDRRRHLPHAHSFTGHPARFANSSKLYFDAACSEQQMHDSAGKIAPAIQGAAGLLVMQKPALRRCAFTVTST